MVSVIGIVAAIALLVFLAFKQWNMLLVSLICAVIVGLTSGIGLWAIFSDYYMPDWWDFSVRGFDLHHRRGIF